MRSSRSQMRLKNIGFGGNSPFDAAHCVATPMIDRGTRFSCSCAALFLAVFWAPAQLAGSSLDVASPCLARRSFPAALHGFTDSQLVAHPVPAIVPGSEFFPLLDRICLRLFSRRKTSGRLVMPMALDADFSANAFPLMNSGYACLRGNTDFGSCSGFRGYRDR